MQAVIKFLRANPQVLVLLIICIVLWTGYVHRGHHRSVTAPTDQTTGEPSGAILGAHAAAHALRAAAAGARAA